jgi:hypothetical protein
LDTIKVPETEEGFKRGGSGPSFRFRNFVQEKADSRKPKDPLKRVRVTCCRVWVRFRGSPQG